MTAYVYFFQVTTPSVFDEVEKEMISLSEVVHKFAFDIVFAPLQEQISRLHEMEVCVSIIIQISMNCIRNLKVNLR